MYTSLGDLAIFAENKYNPTEYGWQRFYAKTTDQHIEIDPYSLSGIVEPMYYLVGVNLANRNIRKDLIKKKEILDLYYDEIEEQKEKFIKIQLEKQKEKQKIEIANL
jgi:hypothetical protein